MKIVQIASSLYDWGGIERYLVYLQQGLMDRGHDVTVVCPKSSPLDQRLPGPKVHQSLKAQFQLTLLPKYTKLLKELKPEIVNIHFGPDFIVPAIAARRAGAKVVMTRHLVLPWKPGKVRRYTKLFDAFIGVSEAVQRKLVESGVPEERVIAVQSGSPALSAKAEKRDNLGAFSVGFFGRIVEEKGVTILAEAAKQAPEIDFHVFGDGPKRQEYGILFSFLQNLKFHGRIEDVADAMNAVDVVAIPSLWEEAFPYSAMEAMSLGKPIVASQTGGLPELVRHGETGFLHGKFDSEAMVAFLRQLREDAPLRERMGRTAQDVHRQCFTVDKMAERMEAAYDRIRNF